MKLNSFPFLITVLLSLSEAPADINVNDPKSITHRVTVNRIRTLSTSGEAATVFGNASQEADIIDKVNQIWAQAGVEIVFENVEDFTNNFAYDNNGSMSGRPRSHLDQILALSGTSVPSSSTDLDMIFVKLCPGFGLLSENTSAGLANVDRSGTTVYVGSALLTFSRGRDVIAGVVAHEIGHNLGLIHTANGGDNLMSPGGKTEQLNQSQESTVFQNNSGTDGFDLLEGLPTAASNYEQFLAEFNLGPGPNEDEDGDGLSNFFEFALGTNPLSGGDTFPALVESSGSSVTWAISKNPDAVADGMSYEIFTTRNLTNWRTAGSNGSSSTLTSNNDSQISARFNLNNSKGFFQLRISLPATTSVTLLTDEMREELAQADAKNENPHHAEGLCACGNH